MKTLSSRFVLHCLALALLLAAPLARSADTQDVVMRAMRDELARSMAQLQLEHLEKPYFISYRVQDGRRQSVSAQFGSTLGRNEGHNRLVTVEVRVGSPALDNTNFQAAGFGGGGGTVSATLATDDRYDILRRQLWLTTDRAYKQAVELLSKKRAALQNKTRTTELPDFSPQPPATITDLRPGKPLDLNQAEALVRELSALFREAPGVANSSVGIAGVEETTRYVNSEGSAFVRSEAQISFGAAATTQAADGFALDDNYRAYARTWEALPPKAALVAAVRAVGRRIEAQSQAALLEQYNGPVLFEGQAAAEIFAQVFAPLLGARPRPVVEGGSGRGGGRGGPGFGGAGVEENPFLDKLGARVLPDIFTVIDNATLTELNGVPLFGDARVDDEGVPTRPVALVEKGRLKTLLASRAPVRGVTRSTGSLRGSLPLPSNLIVSASDALDAAALKAELLKLIEQRGKDYGIIVRRLGNQGGRSVPVILAVKVLPNGREEPLRNLEVAGIDAPAFKDILVAGREPYLHTAAFRGSTCTFVVPALLFEDLTLKKPAGEIGKPPIAKHPFFDQ